MLDYFAIATTGGLILWSKEFSDVQKDELSRNIDYFITWVVIESSPNHSMNQYLFHYYSRDGLMFMALSPSILQINYAEKFLESVSNLFNSSKQNLSLDFDLEFSKLLKSFQSSSTKHNVTNKSNIQSINNPPPSRSTEPKSTNALPSQPTNTKKPKPGKQKRIWEDTKVSKDVAATLDYSTDSIQETNSSAPSVHNLVDDNSMGKTQNGVYDAKELEDSTPLTKTTGLFSYLGGFVGQKTLSESDLEPIMLKMKEHLIKKNVAAEISSLLCQSVSTALKGSKLGTFESLTNVVKSHLEREIQRILTPKTSTDLLREIKISNTKKSVYSITFIGVNGVGKSTNLSKVCFWLLQNNLKILVAACDTFRAGAVEQLRVHVNNLKSLVKNNASATRASVDLFEKGYGKDAANIAKDAIQYANSNHYDVILIDTAGRMQDNEPLMKSLAKLITINNPDKILFVGEALVGNEAVDQLTKFNRAIKDFSQVSNPRHIDGMILTKFDTIDDKVGAALSMTFTTGQPIFFVGTGQTYTDLRKMNISSIVNTLLAN